VLRKRSGVMRAGFEPCGSTRAPGARAGSRRLIRDRRVADVGQDARCNPALSANIRDRRVAEVGVGFQSAPDPILFRD
jgi:hypothetical protein